jgi:hypothetical protein
LTNVVGNRLSIDFKPVGMSVMNFHSRQYKPLGTG